jgi:hypothetical protein
MLAPIAIFAYNRLFHLKKTINALKDNLLANQSELIIFSDAAASAEKLKEVAAVRSYLKTISGFKKVSVIERQDNYGLAINIIEGVSSILKDYEKVIVLEDDLTTSPYFLKYMNDALDLYKEEDSVISVHGYVYPVKAKLPETFFLKGADCLGWGTWKRSWSKFEISGDKLYKELIEKDSSYEFDFEGAYPYTKMLKENSEGKNSSWAVRWYASAFVNGLYTLYPGKSLVFHEGGDGSGVNTGYNFSLDVELAETPINVSRIKIQQSKIAYESFKIFLYQLANPSLFSKIMRRIKKYTDKLNNY